MNGLSRNLLNNPRALESFDMDRKIDPPAVETTLKPGRAPGADWKTWYAPAGLAAA